MAVTRQVGAAPTLLTRDAHRQPIVIARYSLRRAAYRIATDCDHMLETLPHSDRKSWRDAIGEALVASRHLLAIAVQTDDASVGTSVTERVSTIGARIQEPQRRIVDTMTSLVQFVPVSAEEELVLQDARAIRDAALDLLAFAHQAHSTADGDRREQRALSGAGHATTPSPRIRVLVADDEGAVRQVLQRHLIRRGYDVVEAENGRAALEIALREPVDLILTDINMPQLDGMALLKELKNAERTREIPVIVISSQDDLSSVVTCIEQGAEDHISKPYQPLLLQARVRASLARKFMRDLEREYLRRVAELTAAAEAVERESYVAGSLDSLAGQSDALGGLARVFDRMVSGLKSREERLQHRLTQLRHEMTEASGGAAAAAIVSDESPFASGEILAGRYEILGQLGKGGMGMVYRARDLELGEEMAVKVVRRDLVKADPTIVDRLKSEIRLTRRISHRNVVRAHDIGEWKGTYFISMEYVKGITVEQLIDRRGRLMIESTLAIGTQLAEALAVAHELQIIHRDIKPANLLVDEEGVLKVMDFGIARMMEREVNLTLSGFIVGTPQYMAPEQLMGGDGGRSKRPVCRRRGAVRVSGRTASVHGRFAHRAGDANHRRPVSAPRGTGAQRADRARGAHPPAASVPAERPDRVSSRELASKLAEMDAGARQDPAALLAEIDLQILKLQD